MKFTICSNNPDSRPQVASQLQIKIQSTLRASLRISKTCKNFILLPLVQLYFEGNSMTVSQGNHSVVRRGTSPRKFYSASKAARAE